MRDDDAVFLASDCDEQLLINLKFKQPVRLHSIALKALETEKAPNKIKIFVNPVNMSFDAAESDPCTQELAFTEDSVSEGTPVNLRYVKFQNVTSLSVIFVLSFCAIFAGVNWRRWPQSVRRSCHALCAMWSSIFLCIVSCAFQAHMTSAWHRSSAAQISAAKTRQSSTGSYFLACPATSRTWAAGARWPKRADAAKGPTTGSTLHPHALWNRAVWGLLYGPC